ncbi:MAG: hypothetical protein RMJ28_01190 [Nitrososphaerota archaeon]|nr:hypothetical protein [Candidatus Calditenuaceae archaeon]MDW8072843.1 hypothetical protein [Nitrososphaerota archaeon]
MPTRTTTILSTVAILAILSVLFLVISAPQNRQTATTNTVSATETERTFTEGGLRVVTFTLYLWDYGYNASRGGPTLTVNVGDRVRINLVGNGSGPIVHDFVLDQNSPSPYNVRSDRLSRGQTQVIEFSANYPGTFTYYCSVAPPYGLSHRERGQEGTIIVLES